MNDFTGLPVDYDATLFPEASGPSSALERSAPMICQTALVLMMSVSLSSSSTRPEEHWASVFMQSSTTRSTLAEPASPKTGREQHVLPPTAMQLAAVQTAFGLSKTQLAQVCRVQRQTIYDWYAGNFEAEGNNARRLSSLYGIAERLRAEGRPALSPRAVSRALSSGNTLLDLLSRDDVEGEVVGTIVAQLDATLTARSHGAAAARERLGWAPVSPGAADETLDANLDDFVDG